jgi:hypothetical protein
MALNRIPKTGPEMVKSLTNIHVGILANLGTWSPNAPKPETIAQTIEAIGLRTTAVNKSLTEVKENRDALNELLEGNAKDIYISCKDIILAEYKGKEIEFGLHGKKVREKFPVPAVPSNLKAKALSIDSIEVIWEAVEYAKAYKVFVDTNPDPYKMSTYHLALQAQVVLTGLTEGTKYHITIKAVNSTGESDFSNIVDCRTK